MKKKILSIVRILILAIVCVAVGLRLYMWNAETLVGDKMPMPFGWGAAVVLSDSMNPTLAVNDLVFVQAQADYRVGDVVVYDDGKALVIHRLVAVADKDTVVTQGDANSAPDEPVRVERIKGKAVGRIPWVGAVFRFLKSPVGILLMIAAAVVFFELPYYLERKRTALEQEEIKKEIRRLRDEESK